MVIVLLRFCNTVTLCVSYGCRQSESGLSFYIHRYRAVRLTVKRPHARVKMRCQSLIESQFSIENTELKIAPWRKDRADFGHFVGSTCTAIAIQLLYVPANSHTLYILCTSPCAGFLVST